MSLALALSLVSICISAITVISFVKTERVRRENARTIAAIRARFTDEPAD
jgi:hypothetical protein